VKISDVHWVANQLGQAAQDLKLDGRQAHFKTRQRSQFVARGILEGVSFLNSERPDAKENPYVRDSYPPEIEDEELVGCTDNPEVFGLFTGMCDAIRVGTWHPGPRPLTD
jgi:hypothetical protein